jgi:hypothetical protein
MMPKIAATLVSFDLRRQGMLFATNDHVKRLGLGNLGHAGPFEDSPACDAKNRH